MGTEVQLTYTQEPAYGVPGQESHASQISGHRESAVGTEVLYPGRAVEMQVSSGKLRHPQGTAFPASGYKFVGIVLRDMTRENAADGSAAPYAIGESVPYLQRGSIWAELNGGTPARETALNVKHASTDGLSNAQHRGKFTASVTDADAGEEVTATVVVAKQHSMGVAPSPASGIVLVQINIP